MDQNPETTLDITQAMADELTDYLMGDKLYRQVMVQTPDGFKQPKMTIGALLENLQDLAWQRDALNDGQQAALDGIVEQVNIGRNAFSDSWEALLRRELKALLDSWRWYLDDVSRDEAARENYARESRVRTRIDLVQRALADAGIPVGVSVAPQIPFINDDMEQVLEAAAQAGASCAFTTVLRLPWELNAVFQEWLELHYPQRAARVMAPRVSLAISRSNRRKRSFSRSSASPRGSWTMRAARRGAGSAFTGFGATGSSGVAVAAASAAAALLPGDADATTERRVGRASRGELGRRAAIITGSAAGRASVRPRRLRLRPPPDLWRCPSMGRCSFRYG